MNLKLMSVMEKSNKLVERRHLKSPAIVVQINGDKNCYLFHGVGADELWHSWSIGH